jgi:hypothetical protein
MSDSDLELIRRWNQANWDPETVREVVSPDFVAHMPDGDLHGPDGWLRFARQMMDGVSDVAAGSDEVVPSGDLIGERWWIRYTAADGTPVLWRGITMHRVADGKLQEDWVTAQQEHPVPAGSGRTAVRGL